MRIDELSGDSEVKDVRYAHGVVTLLYQDYDSDLDFEITVQTDLMYSDSSIESECVHVRVIRNEDFLNTDPESGRFESPEDFGRQMQMVREGCHLALGLRASEFLFTFQIRSQRLLFA